MEISKLLPYILSLISFFIVLKWDVNSDYKKWLDKKPVNHFKESLIRIVYLIPSVCFLAYPKIINIQNFWYVLLQILQSSLLLSALWWELFDGWYNKKRKFKWRFNGSVDLDDSKSDKFLYKIGDFWEGFLKIILILLFLLLYIFN